MITLLQIIQISHCICPVEMLFEIPLVITLTCSFEIFVPAINFNSVNHGHLKNRHDLETLEKVFK